MREEIPSENRTKVSKFFDQNQAPKCNNQGNARPSNNFSRMKSSWGSHIVKGFSAADKKTKTRVLQTTAHSNKMLPNNTDITSSQKNQPLVSNPKIKRSLIGDLSCSMYATQVHPQTVRSQSKIKSLGSSEDLFLEIDHLRNLLQESKDRELKLQAELAENMKQSSVLELERELELSKTEVDSLVKKMGLLECEKANLTEQVAALTSFTRKHDEMLERNVCHDSLSGVEIEVLELRRLNKELQLQKRNLACKISSLESQLTSLANVSESDIVQKIKAEISSLRQTNEDLCKQVEKLQMSRMNEVEELVYLRWVNSRLRDEMHTLSSMSSDDSLSRNSVEKSREPICPLPFHTDEDSDTSASSTRLYLIKKFKKWPITDDDFQSLKYTDNIVDHNWIDQQGSSRRHSISGTNCCSDNLNLRTRRKSDGFVPSKEIENGMEMLVSQKYDLEVRSRTHVYTNCQEICKMTVPFDVEKRALRIPTPPPQPSCAGVVNAMILENSTQTLRPPPPPPPPPPPKLTARSMIGTVQRSPQVVEFYHSLMKRDSRKECLNSGATDTLDVANVRSSMIDEIENRSSHLIAIKADVETQGEFINFLIREVNSAIYQNIEDVVAFVKWLDDELCFLVDERAVLKHFEWPEKKADTLREAAFGYHDLMKLEQELSNYKDDPHFPCDITLKKTAVLSERMERTVYNILRTRDSLVRSCKEFNIPTDWMLDMGIVSKIKFGSVKLAKMYMKRVAMELQSKGTSDKDSSLDYMLLQGVRFAFRIHQFAGGFDAETMRAFEELRDLAVALNKN